jgi:hypothetical protein
MKLRRLLWLLAIIQEAWPRYVVVTVVGLFGAVFLLIVYMAVTRVDITDSFNSVLGCYMSTVVALLCLILDAGLILYTAILIYYRTVSRRRIKGFAIIFLVVFTLFFSAITFGSTLQWVHMLSR